MSKIHIFFGEYIEYDAFKICFEDCSEIIFSYLKKIAYYKIYLSICVTSTERSFSPRH